MTTPTTTEFNALQSRIVRILEVGDGDFGYGQTALSQQVSDIVPATMLDFQNLRADILNAKQHQVGALSTLPISPISGTLTSTQWTAFSTVLGQVETNRLVTPPSAQASRDILISNTTTSEWNGLTTHTVTVTFTDADAMRHYFNTGSSIEFSASRTSGASNTKNASWTKLLTDIGVISFKHKATSSTKAVGTSIGFSKLTESEQVIFTKSTTDTLKPNTYRIKALKLDDATLQFTIEFEDISTSSNDPNVSGTLTSNVNSYHASGVFVAVPAPIAEAELVEGTPNPSFLLTKDSTTIGEGQTGVTFTVNTTYFDDLPLYWYVKGYGINASDFVENTLEGVVEILDSTGTFSLTASSDMFTEGTEKFVVELRKDGPELTNTVVASISSKPVSITDLSITVPVIVTSPSYNFVSQSVSAVSEGQTISYTVVTTGVADGTELAWSTKGITAGITASDFEDNTLSGTVVIYNNTATIDRTIVNDQLVETAVESFQIVLSTINPTTGLKRPVATSYIMQIIDTVVVVPDVPYEVVNSLTSAPEGSTVGINFKITTPKLPLNTRLYWQTFSDVGTISETDFNDGRLTGSVLITNQTGVVTRYVKADSTTEGIEQFHLVFYSDAAFTNELVPSNTVSITESVNYTVTRSPVSMSEGGTGVTFTVNTPYLENGTILYWSTVSETGTVDESDFADNTLTGTVTIYNNTGTILRRAAIDGLTEGMESFHLEIRATDGTSGPILVSSQGTSITEPDVWDILSQGSEIKEGEIGVEFIIKTPKLPSGTVLYWSTVTDTGTIQASDFTDNRLSGTVTITNNIGSVIRTAAADSLTEGDESFHLVLRTGSAAGTQVAVGSVVSISEYVKYTVTASTQSITEGQAGVTFNITTPKVPNGSLVYWSTLAHAGNITQDDFTVSDSAGGSAQRLSGQVAIQNNRGSFIISGRADGTTEGTESFQIELRLEGVDGPVQDTSRIVTISEIVPYQVIAGAASVAEGSGSVTFTIKTPSTPDGTIVYWTTNTNSGTVNGNDFTDGVTQGSVEIFENTATVIRTAKADEATEGVDAFSLQLRLTGYGSPVVATSGVVVINDTSLTIEEPEPLAPTYAVAFDNGSSFLKPKTGVVPIQLLIHTTNVTSATNLYWTLFRGPGLGLTDFTAINSGSAIHVGYDDGSTPAAGTVPVTVELLGNALAQGVRSFIFEVRTGSIYGPVVATSPSSITITDEASYMVTASSRSMAEAAGTVTFTVTVPQSDQAKPLTWNVVANTGTVDAGDLDAITGTLTAGTTSRTFTLTSINDAATEGNETFHVEILDGSTVVASSPIITISEVVSYSLTANKSSISEGDSGVIFTFTTPKLTANTQFNYTIVGKTGSLSAADFDGNSLTGTFTVTAADNSGTFTVVAKTDSSTEGNESFYVNITSITGQSITLGTPAPVITITENVSYSISASATTGAESTQTEITFTVRTPSLPNDTTLYWEVVQDTGTIAADDFVENRTSGPVTITNNIGTIKLTHKNDKITEGDESYHLILREGSAQGSDLGVSSPVITISELVGYTLTANKSAIVEGEAVTFTVSTPKLDDGTILNWAISNISGGLTAADFSPNSLTGTVTINNNTGTFNVAAAIDASNESDNKFTVSIFNGAVQVATSTTISIADSNNYTLTPNTTVIAEGGTGVEFTVGVPATSTETQLYWSVLGVSGNAQLTDFVTASGTVKIDPTSRNGKFTVAAKADSEANEGDTFTVVLKTGSQTGNIIPIANPPEISITDKEFYTISSDKTEIEEGGAGVTFTINTPAADNGTTLYWKVLGNTGIKTAIETADFTGQAMSGQVTVTNKVATIPVIVAAADQKTEGLETFIIQLSKVQNGTAIVFDKPSPVVKIIDSSVKGTIAKYSIALTVDQLPTSIIEGGNGGDVVIKVVPVGTTPLTSVTVDWKIINASQTILNAITTSVSTRVVNSGKLTTAIDASNPMLSYASMKLFTIEGALKSSGNCQIQFTVTDPVTKNVLSIASQIIKIEHGDEIWEFKSSQAWTVPTDVKVVRIDMLGGGGTGGGAGAAFNGGAGGIGASVSGILDVSEVKQLYFNFLPGGASKQAPAVASNDLKNDWTTIGGTGGAGISLHIGNSKSGYMWASVGGAGGGGAGRVNGTAHGGSGDGSNALSVKDVYKNAGTVAKYYGDGGSGGGGGAKETQPYNYTNQAAPNNAVSRVGGNGGYSYVPSISGFVFDPIGGGTGGAGVELIAKQPPSATWFGTSYKSGKTVYVLARAFQDYGIGPDDARPKEPLVVSWNNVVGRDGNPIPQGNYYLQVFTDGIGAVVINDVAYGYKSSFSKDADKVISIPAGWNNRITICYQSSPSSKTNYLKTNGVSVTLRPADEAHAIATDANYIWTSKAPNALMRPKEGSGSAGQPAVARISYGPSVDAIANNAVKPDKNGKYPVAATVPSLPGTEERTVVGGSTRYWIWGSGGYYGYSSYRGWVWHPDKYLYVRTKDQTYNIVK